jgi:1-acyl-sn-glycerol-3-phosphate acyltransferase
MRSILIFTPLVWIYTIILAAISLVCSLFDHSGRVQHKFARFWSWLILKSLMCPLEVSGLDESARSKPRVYAANHLSALDIPVLYAGLPMQFRIMAKRELFRYPFLGWYLRRSGQIAVDVEDVPDPASPTEDKTMTKGKINLASVRAVLHALRGGMPLVIFPEGGRSRSGRMKPFMSGAFFFAIKAGVEVVPMAIGGTNDALPMNTFHVRPRILKLTLGAPIATSSYSSRQAEELAARVQREVEALYNSVTAPEREPVLGSR